MEGPDPTKAQMAVSSMEAKDDGVKGAKQGPRKRVSQACDKCRSRKDKCDGKKPECSTCTANGRTCSYDTNVKKRGLPEGYVRGLEKLWGLAIRDVDAVEDQILVALAGNEESVESPLSIWNDEATSEALVELWRKSQMSRELERLLSSQEPTVETKRMRLGSDIQAPRKNRTRFPQSSVGRPRTETAMPPRPESGADGTDNSEYHKPLHSSHSYQDNNAFLYKDVESILSPSNAHTSLSTGTPAASVDAPELPSETWHLIDVYFSYTHSWLPIIEKHDLLRTSYQYSQCRGTSSLPGSGEHAALWAAIAYAKFQHRAINNIPRALGPVGEMVWTAERMYAQARSLVPNEEGVLELGHVQAILILTLANMGMGHYNRAWSLIGQAVRVAIDLQLDQPPDPVATLLKPKTRSKHVILGCFLLETLIAARLGRKPHLRAHDIDLIGLVEEDGLEEWDPWTDCLQVTRNKFSGSRGPSSILSTFNRCIEVLKILNEATCLSVGSNSSQLSTALLEKLHIWSHSQSSPLYFDSTSVESEAHLLPHQYHLHNVYFITLATSQLLLHTSGDSSVNLEPCTRTARHTVDLLQQHSRSFGLLIVPPTYDYFVHKTYEIVRAVNSSIESTHIVLNDWKRNLDHCLEQLEPAWPVFESLKSTVAYQTNFQSARRESQVAFDLFRGRNQDSETPNSSKTPQSIASYDAMNAYSPQTFRSQAEIVQRTRTDSQPGKRPVKDSHRSSFGHSSSQGLPQNPLNIYENAHVTFGGLNRRIDKAASRPPLPVGRQTIDLTQPANPQLLRSLTMSSADVEFDPVFNELMRLDATEWAGNWDQSLMNLGFTDTGNMNQDFYTFCQEPDPLHQNNVFQQLVANSNAENTDLFNGSAFNGMSADTGMNTCGGLGIGDENEGIEAGQILQALSAAEDRRSVRENG